MNKISLLKGKVSQHQEKKNHVKRTRPTLPKSEASLKSRWLNHGKNEGQVCHHKVCSLAVTIKKN
jgi:hypothetical protein